MRKLLVFMILAGTLSLSLQAQVPVPKRMTYCGMDLTITPGAQRIIEDYVAKIYESPRYFNQMVKRAMIYVPFIEEAFDNVGVPQDLKYLAIQESALRPDVVSSSNAVGFWQFKAPTAKEYGLRVNDKVDERQHIYRASEAAAAYLKANNRDFDNWIYAVLAYYEGPTGAVKHTDPAYYSNPKMTVTESLHWYVLKAIAHKIAYEGPLSTRKVPPLVLRPTSNFGEHNVAKLIEQSDSDPQEFADYNKWMLDGKKLPKNELFTYYIPLNADLYTGHVPDPNKVSGGGMPVFDQLTQLANTASSQSSNPPPVETTQTEPIQLNPTNPQPTIAERAQPKIVDQGMTSSLPTDENAWTSPAQPQVRGGNVQLPKALPTSGLNSFTYVEFSLQADLHYGRQYVLYDGSFYLVELANKFETRLTDLLVWNGLIPGEEPVKGNMVYLDKPSRLDYHIVRPGESLFDIAALHLSTVKKLQKLNRIDKRDYTIYVGQKLYLKEKKPRAEKMIILTPQKESPIPAPTASSSNVNPLEQTNPNTPSTPSAEDNSSLTKISDLAKATPRPTPTQTTRPEGVTETELAAANAANNSGEMPAKRWVQHTVKPGETLWAISQLYGTKVEIIKQINKLENDYISEGQVLRILADF
ncbi:MAG: LysM peptidoglycan-binding domain-containing protein [Bacteroidia bacterium]